MRCPSNKIVKLLHIANFIIKYMQWWFYVGAGGAIAPPVFGLICIPSLARCNSYCHCE